MPPRRIPKRVPLTHRRAEGLLCDLCVREHRQVSSLQAMALR